MYKLLNKIAQIKPKLENNSYLVWVIASFTIVQIFAGIIFHQSISRYAHPPDHNYHTVMTKLYSQNPKSLFITRENQLDYVCENHSITRVAPVITTPSLYANITGKSLFIVDQIINDSDISLSVIQMLQVGFGLVNLFYIYKISEYVFKDKLPRIFTILIISNIQMFSYLYNYLNYDNLLNLASTLSIYYLINYLKTKDVKNIIILIIWLCIGSLTKFTIGPLLIIILTITVIYENKKLPQLFINLKDFFLQKSNYLLKSWFVVILVLTFLFFGNNVVNHKALFTSSKQSTLEVEHCVNFLNVESIDDSEEESTHSIEQTPDTERKNVLEYFMIWSRVMVTRTINIASHKSLYKPEIYTNISLGIIVFSFLLLAIKYRLRNRYINVLLIITLSYIGYLFAYRYSYYLTTNNIDTVISGRYMFPVIAPFTTVIVYVCWNYIGNKKISLILLLSISAFLFYADKMYLLQNYHVWRIVDSKVSPIETSEPIFLGQDSQTQLFNIGSDYSNKGLAIYISTYTKTIKDGYLFNLYESDCKTLLQQIELNNIKDNDFHIIEFNDYIKADESYCFNVKNISNELPIVLWYGENSNGEETNTDYEKNIIYTPLYK